MQLVSRLGHTTLGDLLASLHRAGASGVLELIEPHARHAIHLRRGYVQAVESDSVASRLGDVATRVHGITRPVVERARMYAQQRGLRIGQALVATHAIRPGDLDDLLAAQQRERLERLYTLDDADVRFRVARPLPAGASEQSPLPPRDVFYGRPRKHRRVEARGSARMPPPSPNTPRVIPRQSAHDVLGVTPGVDAPTLRAAFKRLVLELHPDRATDVEAEEKAARSRRLVAVLDAYRSLRVT